MSLFKFLVKMTKSEICSKDVSIEDENALKKTDFF